LLSLVTGMNIGTIRRERREFDEELDTRLTESVHQAELFAAWCGVERVKLSTKYKNQLPD